MGEDIGRIKIVCPRSKKKIFLSTVHNKKIFIKKVIILSNLFNADLETHSFLASNSSWNISNESLNCPLASQIAKNSKSHLCKNPCTQMCKHLFGSLFFGPPGRKIFFQPKKLYHQLAFLECFLSSFIVSSLRTLWKALAAKM